MTSFFLYAYTQFQCSMELGKKRKRFTNWTHTKKVVLQHTVSQLAIEQLCEQQENHVDTDTSSYPLSQGSRPQFLHIKRNVIPHKCTSRSCQMFNKMSNQSCQVSVKTISKSVQVAISKEHVSTQCYCVKFSKYKGMSKYARDEKYWENFFNFLEKNKPTEGFCEFDKRVAKWQDRSK